VEIEGSADSNEDAAGLYDALAGRGQDDAAAEAGQAAEAMWKLLASKAEGASFGEIGLDGLPRNVQYCLARQGYPSDQMTVGFHTTVPKWAVVVQIEALGVIPSRSPLRHGASPWRERPA
jgi:hypothetical protein